MKPLMLAGAAITALGIVMLIFHNGINYTAREKYPKDGEAQIITHQEKVVSVPLVVGGATLLGGIAIMILAARR